jgi:bacillithiol synthase
MKFPLHKTKILSSTTQEFVLKSPKIKNILGENHPYFDIEKAIKGKSDFKNRAVLTDALYNQYDKIWKNDETDALVKSNIEKLKQKNTFTITTGQQLHLFFGPVFVLYKIKSIIDTAKLLNEKYPEHHFVPVYWMASEDHDFEEIQNTSLFNKNFTWETNQTGACGRFNLKSVQKLIDTIKAEVSLNESQTKLLNQFETIYQNQETLSKATAAIVHEFFGKDGVVCIDGDDPILKKTIIPLIHDDVIKNINFEVFNQTGDFMKKEGLSLQLGAREINFFYLNKGVRSRIVKQNDGYEVLDSEIKWLEKDIVNLIENSPEMFSPNALMRPLYQESILPNVMYIGGNAEVNYWIQLHKNLNINNINPPQLQLRPSMWIIPHKVEEKLEKMNVNTFDLLKSTDEKEILELLTEDQAGIEDLIEEFKAYKEKVQSIVAQYIAKDLKTFVEQGKLYEKVLKNADKLIKEKKIEQHQKEIEKLLEIKTNFLNINKIQERVTNSLEMLIKYGNLQFLDENLAQLNGDFGYIKKI